MQKSSIQECLHCLYYIVSHLKETLPEMTSSKYCFSEIGVNITNKFCGEKKGHGEMI